MQVTLEADRPSLRVQFSHTAHLQCCYNTTKDPPNSTWIHHVHLGKGIYYPKEVPLSHPRATFRTNERVKGSWCQNLTLTMVQLEDVGLYRCFLNHSSLRPSVYTHGTFLQVYGEYLCAVGGVYLKEREREMKLERINARMQYKVSFGQ